MLTRAMPTADGQTIGGLHVRLYGPEDGQPIVLSAGLGGLGGYWTPQLGALGGYRIILYDHRGTGTSARDLPSPYAITNLADDIRIVLDGLGYVAAHIVGHAAGGLAGLQLAIDAPERVKSLTVVNGWAIADRHFRRCFDIRLGIYETAGPRGYLRAQPLFLFPAEWISDHLDELDEQAAHHAHSFQSEAALRSRIKALTEFDILASASRVTCPVLVLSSTDDILVPAKCSRQLASCLPNAKHIEMRWGGHAVNITAQAEFNTHLLTFLEG